MTRPGYKIKECCKQMATLGADDYGIFWTGQMFYVRHSTVSYMKYCPWCTEKLECEY